MGCVGNLRLVLLSIHEVAITAVASDARCPSFGLALPSRGLAATAPVAAVRVSTSSSLTVRASTLATFDVAVLIDILVLFLAVLEVRADVAKFFSLLQLPLSSRLCARAADRGSGADRTLARPKPGRSGLCDGVGAFVVQTGLDTMLAA